MIFCLYRLLLWLWCCAQKEKIKIMDNWGKKNTKREKVFPVFEKNVKTGCLFCLVLCVWNV